MYMKAFDGKGFASISAKIWRGAIAPLAPQSDGPELQQNHCQSRGGEPKGAFSIIDVMQLCMQQSKYTCKDSVFKISIKNQFFFAT